MIVRNVGHMRHGDQPAEEHNAVLRGRITYSLRVLVEYANALRLVRESGIIILPVSPDRQAGSLSHVLMNNPG